MNEKGVKVYIYGLLDNNNNITYVGKASEPKKRLYWHASQSNSRKLKILDYFYDKEMLWIKKLSKQYNLTNIIDDPYVEDWAINDIIKVNKLTVRKFVDKKTNTIYNSIKEATEMLNLDRHRVHTLLFNESIKRKYKDKYDFHLLD